MKHIKQLFFIVIVLISGCDEPGLVESSLKIDELSGNATTNGTLRNANVEIYSIQGGKISSTPIVNTHTNLEGQFVFSIPSVGVTEMMLIKVSGNESGTTLLQCNLVNCGPSDPNSRDINMNGLIDFGEWQAVGSDFVLHSYIVNWKENEPININIVTHLIANNYNSPPSPEELRDEYDSIQEFLGLNESPDSIPLINMEDISNNQGDVIDSLIMASLFNYTHPIEEINMAERLNYLTEYLDGGHLSDSGLISITNLTASAIEIAEHLPNGSNQNILDDLMLANSEAAIRENMLPITDLPILPPLL